MQSALAQCPHNTTNCVVVVKTLADAATIVPTDLRFVKLEALGTYATLTINVMKAGTGGVTTAPTLKQRIGDVCTWIVETKCEAPVITVGSTSSTLAATAEV